LLRRLLRDGHNFGASAPGPALMREYGLTAENVCKRALALMEKNNV
jgi:transketolase